MVLLFRDTHGKDTGESRLVPVGKEPWFLYLSLPSAPPSVPGSLQAGQADSIAPFMAKSRALVPSAFPARHPDGHSGCSTNPFTWGTQVPSTSCSHCGRMSQRIDVHSHTAQPPLGPQCSCWAHCGGTHSREGLPASPIHPQVSLLCNSCRNHSNRNPEESMQACGL